LAAARPFSFDDEAALVASERGAVLLASGILMATIIQLR
jgi:hypothetical protein